MPLLRNTPWFALVTGYTSSTERRLWSMIRGDRRAYTSAINYTNTLGNRRQGLGQREL